MMNFKTFFGCVHKDDKGNPVEPFPWQATLAERVLAEGRWPKLIDLPTASGKTACIDVAVWAMACEADKPPAERRMPRRIWFVVDRRIVVDEAARRAEQIQTAIINNGELAELKRALFDLRGVREKGGLPLAVARLRGGGTAPTDETDADRDKRLRVEAHNDSWQTVPTQPAVLLSTVDQLGSRLLFRGYGVSPGMWPIHAALAGNDSLVLLDEAHIAEPLRQTLGWVARHRRTAPEPIRTPWHVAFMTATPGQPDEGDEWPVFPSPAERADALRHDLLDQRRDASKRATLDVVPGEKRDEKVLAEKVLKHVGEMLKHGRTRVAVMLNRVDSALGVEAALKDKKSFEELDPERRSQVDLLTGRMRPIDRVDFIEKLHKSFGAKPNRPPLDGPPRVLVTTQCLEVGADFDFDGLVTECASLDALRQRFGRLDRLGEVGRTDAAILTVAPDAKEPDPIYGEGLTRTHEWLREVAVDHRVDFGIGSLAASLERSPPKGDVASLLGTKPDAPVLMPAYLDAWCQTGPRPATEAEVSLFLHGVRDDVAEVEVVFRCDLPETLTDDEVAAVVRLCPPARGEMLPVKLGRLRAWISQRKPPDEADVAGIEDKGAGGKPKDVPPPKYLFCYAGGRGAAEVARVAADDVRPGDVVIVPLTGDEMPAALGNKPADAPLDRFEDANAAAGRRPTARLMDEDARRLVEKISRPADQAEDEEAERDAKKAALDELATLLAGRWGFAKPKPPDRGGEWQYHLHPSGGAIVVGPPPKGRPSVDPFADPDDLLVPSPKASDADRLLDAHQERAATFAAAFAERCVPDHQDRVAEAARHHDDGKADPRFQGLLAGSALPLEALAPTELFAKSEGPRPRNLERWLRDHLGLPPGFRHEFVSMQLLQCRGDTDNLLLHLIAAHHGHARPFAPVVFDGQPMLPDVPPPHAIGSGVAERFWHLTRRHGWWGLAYLEAMLRLADHHASRFPAKEENDA